jgi:hypothetical protein
MKRNRRNSTFVEPDNFVSSFSNTSKTVLPPPGGRTVCFVPFQGLVSEFPPRTDALKVFSFFALRSTIVDPLSWWSFLPNRNVFRRNDGGLTAFFLHFEKRKSVRRLHDVNHVELALMRIFK